MTTIGHVFIPLNRAHDGMVPTDDDQARFESLPVPLALWEPFQQCLSKHLSELTEGQVDAVLMPSVVRHPGSEFLAHSIAQASKKQ